MTRQRPIIKVCGMREGENIAQVEQLGVDMMGFIFYPPSPRYVDSLPSVMPQKVARVGVFVNEELECVERRVSEFSLQYIQLHGSEQPSFCGAVARLGVKVIKAFSIDQSFDFEQTQPYEECCDMFVFDTKCSGYGGSGQSFDWAILERYKGATPFLLSGGISLENVEQLKSFSHAQMVGYDLNSRFEVSPALKSVELIKQFLEQLK